MTLVNRIVRLSLMFLLATSAHAQDSESAGKNTARPATLRVITYNVQFLPGPAAAMNERKEPEYRAKRIAEEVAKFDLVALQEVFDEKYQTLITEGVRVVWGAQLNVFASPKPEGRYTNGGCLLLTRLPILATHSMVFEHYSTKEDYGVRADGFAAKGVIHAQLPLDGANPARSIDVFVTHLEARADHLRPAQYAEAAAFIKAYSDPSRPALFLGDMNTKGTPDQWPDPASQYSVMLRTYSEARPGAGFIDVWPTLMGTAHGGTSEQESSDIGKRIDYILLANPAAAFQLTPISIAVNLYQDPKTVALSDHNAVIAEFAWNPLSASNETRR